MKKTKILIPSIAILALSAAASVTGTVAWFSASAKTTINVTNIAAVNTNAGLTVTLANVAGTGTITNGSGAAGSSVSLEKLRDASYDAVNKQLYIANVDENAIAQSFVAVSNQKVTVDEEDVYVAAQFTGTFTTVGGSADDTYSVFFDGRATYSALVGDSTDAIRNSIRVALNYADNRYLVWSPLGATATYVNGTAQTAIGTYDNNHFVNASTTVYNQDTLTAGKATNFYVADIKGASSTNTIVNFTIWFEGTDTSCITDNIKDAAYALKMGFYAIKNN